MVAPSLPFYYAIGLLCTQSSIVAATTSARYQPSPFSSSHNIAVFQHRRRQQPSSSASSLSWLSSTTILQRRSSSADFAFVSTSSSSPSVWTSTAAKVSTIAGTDATIKRKRSRAAADAASRAADRHPSPISINIFRSGSISSSRTMTTTSLLAKKYGAEDSDTKKKNQQELLIDLETKLDYEGRISSKILEPVSMNEEDGDDGEEASLVDSSMVSSVVHRCALLTILGMPNMGKSTLLNALLSDDLAIATSRPQTTRHAILGVMTTDYTQLCLTDTPGIIGNPAYRLQEGMMETVRGAVMDADVFLVVTDVYSGVTKKNDDDDAEGNDGEKKEIMEEEDGLGIGEEMLEKLRKYEKPVIVCVNKVDLVAEDKSDGNSVYTNTPAQAIQTIQKWRSVLPNAFAILPTCAANGPDDPGVVALRSILLANDPNVDVGLAIRGLGRPVPGMFANNAPMITDEETREILPEGPPLYHPDFFTDRTDRFCASELIRETLFLNLGKELPYCCEVRVETFDESKRYLDEDEDSNNTSKQKSMIRIGATILVERESQIGIVVGKGGQKIKDVGMDARKKLQEFFGTKVFLDLRVKVDKNWRNDAEKLKKYGYMQ